MKVARHRSYNHVIIRNPQGSRKSCVSHIIPNHPSPPLLLHDDRPLRVWKVWQVYDPVDVQTSFETPHGGSGGVAEVLNGGDELFAGHAVAVVVAPARLEDVADLRVEDGLLAARAGVEDGCGEIEAGRGHGRESDDGEE